MRTNCVRCNMRICKGHSKFLYRKNNTMYVRNSHTAPGSIVGTNGYYCSFCVDALNPIDKHKNE